jgi:Na+-driven multidrug efflux pump
MLLVPVVLLVVLLLLQTTAITPVHGFSGSSPTRLWPTFRPISTCSRRRPLHIRQSPIDLENILPNDKTEQVPVVDASLSHDDGTVEYSRRLWPCWDALDRRLIAIALPVIANFAIGPLIGAVDLFWVNRMGNALAVAGQAAANQVFNSVFWLTSFLPSVTATLISKENALDNSEGVQDAVCQAMFVGICLALLSSILMLLSPDRVLSSVLPSAGAPALEFARPYFVIRSFAFVPALVSLVGFSAFRGVLDTMTPVKISLFANVFNAILDPILIFPCAMRVSGGTTRFCGFHLSV